MRNLKKNRQKGITLIALVVTIVVLIILATVSILAVFGDNGIIARAQTAKDTHEKGKADETNTLDDYASYIGNYLAGKGGSSENTTSGIIEKTKSYVGYYADIDGDGTVDGVIYADLAVGGSGQWSDSDGAFSYEAITGVKDYTISQANYSGDFGDNGVLKATGSGKDRFYVMALENITHTWYKNAASSGIRDYNTITSESFGSGKTNTATMIAKWNSSAYGDQVDTDMWKAIQTQVNKGWFVPSKEEWSAFGSNLGIDSTSYVNHNLSDYCWSSSLEDKNHAWGANFLNGFMSIRTFDDSYYVRLSATF